MPLISHGSFDAFRGTTSGPAETEYGVAGAQPFSVLREITRALQPVPVTFVRSPSPVRANIAGISVTAGGRGMLRRVLDPDADVNVLAWSWDLGAPPAVHPDRDADPAPWRLALAGDRRELAAPLPVWADRPLTGGLAVRVILWQGEHKELPAEIAEAMRHSRLASVLAAVGETAHPTITSAVLVREAAGMLGAEIAPVLRAFCPDYVDFFEGFFPVAAAPGPAAETTFTGYHGRLAVSLAG